jgi:alpha-L-fucosidase 2
LLPALPEAWPSGRIAGLRARGGFEVDMDWAGGRLTRARIRSTMGGMCRVRCRTPVRPAHLADSEYERLSDGAVAFATEAGQSYELARI